MEGIMSESTIPNRKIWPCLIMNIIFVAYLTADFEERSLSSRVTRTMPKQQKVVVQSTNLHTTMIYFHFEDSLELMSYTCKLMLGEG